MSQSALGVALLSVSVFRIVSDDHLGTYFVSSRMTSRQISSLLAITHVLYYACMNMLLRIGSTSKPETETKRNSYERNCSWHGTKSTIWLDLATAAVTLFPTRQGYSGELDPRVPKTAKFWCSRSSSVMYWASPSALFLPLHLESCASSSSNEHRS